MSTDRILVVDDEATILAVYRLQLAEDFQIDTADNGHKALALCAERPYAVIVADMHMPGMTGTELLRRVQAKHPKTVRIMLTADDKQAIAVDAVNEGQIFRFLNKPCPAERLAKALRAGLEQHRLIMAEKELLANTLQGSVSLMAEILSIVNPLAFGRAMRVRQLVQKLCDRLTVENSWEITVAAMLSQVGCVSLPESILKKLLAGEQLTPAESKLYASHPQLGRDLVAKIPRLQRIAEIIALQQRPHDPDAASSSDAKLDTALRAAFLKVALDFDGLCEQRQPPEQAIRNMLERSATYDLRVLRTLAEIVRQESGQQVQEVAIGDLGEGMVLEQDLVDASGMILINKGQEIRAGFLERLRDRNTASRLDVREPIRVLAKASSVSQA